MALSDEQRAAWYDAENTWGDDDGLFLELANATPHRRVLDLGCGTGRLTTALAAAGHIVTGVDPDKGALEAAARKPHGEKVGWLVGTSSALLQGAAFDLALMTGHVAQAIVGAEEWAETLADLHRVLVPGGTLAFDSRDPDAHAWKRWNPDDSRAQMELPDGSRVEGWYEVLDVAPSADGGLTIVTFDDHGVFPGGVHETTTASLAFRTERRLREDLTRAGFMVERVDGGWHREPVGAGVGELVVVARR
jgi:SAM-dependent methyltransferase